MKLNALDQKICRIYRFAILLFGIGLGLYNLLFSTTYYVLLSFSFCFFAAVPTVLDWVFQMKAVYRLHLSIHLFVTLAYGVGMLFNGYHIIPYFDKFAHLMSGVAFTMIGSCLFYSLKSERTLSPQDGPLNSVFSLSFSLAIAGLWEILEYGLDFILHNDPQKVLTTGIHDTMQDIIACLLGSLVVVVFLLQYYRTRKSNFFSQLIERYCEVNL